MYAVADDNAPSGWVSQNYPFEINGDDAGGSGVSGIEVTVTPAPGGGSVSTLLVPGDHYVVATNQVESGLFVVSDQAIGNPGIFVTVIEPDPVFSMVGDGHAVNKNLLDQDRLESMPTLFVTGNSKIG